MQEEIIVMFRVESSTQSKLLSNLMPVTRYREFIF